ncbi:MAG TPA: response regulator [Kofleriaceae bacterium]|nr:response regulator [Kofleriaceae bacterium]
MTRPIRVLLVEDNPGDADLIREILEDGEPVLDITVIADGAEAKDYLVRAGTHAGAPAPDLVLLDLNLPRLDGGQVLAELKRHDRLRRIPVIVLTSSDTEKDIARSYELGASCYVTKPGDLASFQAAVRAIRELWLRVAKLP